MLDKVFTWVTSSMILHLGKTAGKIISAAADANPEATLKRVMPFLTDRVTALLESHVTVDEVDEDTDAPLDDELEWLVATRLAPSPPFFACPLCRVHVLMACNFPHVL